MNNIDITSPPLEIIAHPANMLQPDWINTIRSTAPAAEKAGKILPEQLELIYEQQWFKMLTPQLYGGLELDLNEEVRLLEALSWADGSLGWVVTLCTGASWFGGFLNPEMAKEVFADKDVCLAGSGAPNGIATQIDKGYIVTGLWQYASGALSTTHFTANCKVIKNNEPVLDENGKQLIIPFVFKKHEVNVIPAWNYSGMVATGSHSFEVNALYVPNKRSFKIDADFAVINSPLYIYPFLQLAEATIAANISGMAVHFIDLCKDAFAAKRANKHITPEAQATELNEMLDWAIGSINLVRDEFYEAVDRSWLNYANADAENRDKNLKDVSTKSRKLAKHARQIVDELYPYCGLEAAKPITELNRVWRDIHTASQHSLLTFAS